MTKDREVTQYMDAIRGGASEPLEKLAISAGYIERPTGPIPSWSVEELGFLRTKKGPKPYNNSMVAHVTLHDSIGRYFFIDVYDENPFLEDKLSKGIDIVTQLKVLEMTKRDPDDVFLSPIFQCGTENLIQGEDAVRYLIGLKDDNPTGLFPLSGQRYEKLIKAQRSIVKDLEDSVGDYTPQEIEDMQKYLDITTAHCLLPRERTRLKRLEEMGRG